MVLYKYQGGLFPAYLKDGNACQYIAPIAKQFCKGEGLDIGGTKEWHLDGAEYINNDLKYNAFNLPDKKYDYIFSSHTLEHLIGYVHALEIWRDHLKKGGVLFLYLPHKDMYYWRPENNKKHLQIFEVETLKTSLETIGFKNILYGERDLFFSFAITGVKK